MQKELIQAALAGVAAKAPAVLVAAIVSDPAMLGGVTAPATGFLSPVGKLLWQAQGPFDAKKKVAAASEQMLVQGGRLAQFGLQLGVQQGILAPDFLIECAPGQQMTVRSLRQRSVALTFWTSWCPPSLMEMKRQDEAQRQSQGRLVVLAINDGEDPTRAAAAYKAQQVGVTLVTDAKRDIATLS